jgi:hypothetical protein
VMPMTTQRNIEWGSVCDKRSESTGMSRGGTTDASTQSGLQQPFSAVEVGHRGDRDDGSGSAWSVGTTWVWEGIDPLRTSAKP